MKKTVICHFYNEQFLLPWWLTFHREKFDHGIMIDYGSDDASRSIIEKIVPDWDIIRTRNETFHAPDIDTEVMSIEQGITGWKVALNVTEFLCGNLDEALRDARRKFRRGVTSRHFVTLIEKRDGTSVSPVSGLHPDRYVRHIPLHNQIHWGIPGGPSNRSRLIHCYPDGRYVPGRHVFERQWHSYDCLTTVHYAMAPMCEAFVKRKLQIQHKMPVAHQGMGAHHITTHERILDDWSKAQNHLLYLPHHFEWWVENTGVRPV